MKLIERPILPFLSLALGGSQFYILPMPLDIDQKKQNWGEKLDFFRIGPVVGSSARTDPIVNYRDLAGGWVCGWVGHGLILGLLCSRSPKLCVW